MDVLPHPARVGQGPAPDGNTYPLSWRCGAPQDGEFVDLELFYRLVMAQVAPDGHGDDRGA
ncbi:hypothetical protein ACFVZJ_32190 [Streptomyces sp. NPDC058322]|uniref:hypothetical protein n=1 Tax=unclassified Streptomyces TaxID=2593676 RepID=UPI003412D868